MSASTRTSNSSLSKFFAFVAAVCMLTGGVYIVRDWRPVDMTKKATEMKQREGECKFVLSTSWNPPQRADMTLSYRFGTEVGTPHVTVSPWILARRGSCSTAVQITVSQVVYLRRTASCKITVAGVTVDRVGPVHTREFECKY